MSQEIEKLVQSLYLLTPLSVASHWAGTRWGFFRPLSRELIQSISIWKVLLSFGLYFLLPSFFNALFSFLAKVSDFFIFPEQNVAFILTTLLILPLFTFERRGFSPLFVGLSALFIALPLCFFAGNLLDLLLMLAGDYIPSDQTSVAALKYVLVRGDFFEITSLLAIICFFAPLLEELLFRGFLQNFLKRFLGPGAAILVSSAVFAAFHYSAIQGMSNLSLLSSLFLLALYLGYSYERERSLLAPIAFHCIFNTLSVGRVFLEMASA